MLSIETVSMKVTAFQASPLKVASLASQALPVFSLADWLRAA
jgi:hypothetical protein